MHIAPSRYHLSRVGYRVAGLTLVTCGAIEFATPLTPTGTVLPPTWVLVVVLAGVFMAAAWSAAAGTRRGCLFVTLGIMTATRRELA